MTSILTEIRQSARRLAGSPGYSVGVFLMLTLGLALSVGMYTVLNGVILSGLPYPGGERVVEIRSVNARQNETDGGLTAAEAFALADAAVFEQAGWYRWYGWTVLHGERPREIDGAYVSAEFFATLGIPAQTGRWIDAGDIRANSEAVVLSDHDWVLFVHSRRIRCRARTRSRSIRSWRRSRPDSPSCVRCWSRRRSPCAFAGA
jgi:hypothetical protein